MRIWADEAIRASCFWALILLTLGLGPLFTSFWREVILLYLSAPFLHAVSVRTIELIMWLEYIRTAACFKVKHVEVAITF